jgi:4-amino-4-deoxy-L-arabinose transferase-like glycosyltransferase
MRRILRALLATAAAAAILIYLGVALVHLRYPYEIEWIEGGMVDEVRRAATGQPLYVAPTLDYVPFIYAPLWFYLAAAASRVFGVGFFAARLVSVLASLVSLALIARTVHRETKDRTAALAAAGVFAATYPLATAFYDLARVDSLFVACALGGLYLVRFRAAGSARATVAAAALFALAFFTKQSGPIVFAPVALYVWLEDRRRGALFAAAGAALMGVPVLVWTRLSDGWFWHFVFTLPSHHERVKRFLLTFWWDDMLWPRGVAATRPTLIAVACLFAVFYLAAGSAPAEPGRPRRFYLLASAGMVGASLAGRMHLGGWRNVCSPAYAMLAVLFGLGLHAALSRASARPERRDVFVLGAAALQMLLMLYDPRPYLPSREHEAAWRDLTASVEAMDGDVYVSAHGFVGSRVGKPVHAHQSALSDELRSGRGEAADTLRREVRRSLVQKRFGTIVLDNEWMPKAELNAGYERSGEVKDRQSLGPVLGWPVAQPQSIWVARP